MAIFIYFFYLNYHPLQRYNINIRDENQPLLVTKPKEKNIRGGDDKPVWLIPELCRITGMTERQRNDIG